MVIQYLQHIPKNEKKEILNLVLLQTNYVVWGYDILFCFKLSKKGTMKMVTVLRTP